jgi:hypothetical protein
MSKLESMESMGLNYYEQIGVPCNASSLLIRKCLSYLIGLHEL